MVPKVTVVLVNYNAQCFMADFFQSLSEQDYENIDVVLVDNHSQDASAAWLAEHEKSVRILRLKENTGFGEGCNIGMQEAIAHGTDYVLLLNLDTVLEANLVSELVKYADENTVTTASVYYGTRGACKRAWYAGGEIDKKMAVVNQVAYKKAEKSCYDVGFISGCCMLIHHKVIEKAGYFDKDYFLYYEDTDYCVRLQKAGVSMRYVTTSGLWHKVGGSSIGGHELSCSTQYYVTRNRLLFAERHAGILEDGTLAVLRQILSERAFFDGNGQERYRLYIKAAVEDYLKQHYGRGFYGHTLICGRYYMDEGFHEREDDGKKFWYWAKSRSARIYLANPMQEDVIYDVSFELSVPETRKEDASLQILADGKEVGIFQMPVPVHFMAAVPKEGTVCLELLYCGEIGKHTVDSNERLLCYQILNMDVRERKGTGQEVHWGRSFLDEETGQGKHWRWSDAKEGSVYFINNTDKTQISSVEFEITPFAEKEGSKVVIYENDVRMLCLENEGRQRCLLETGPQKITELRIRTDFAVRTEHSGLRNLCFCVSDFAYSNIVQEISMGQEFYPQETDGINCWYWAREKEAEVIFVYTHSRQFDIEFFADCEEAYAKETFRVLLDGKLMGEFRYMDIVRLAVDNAVRKRHRLRIIAGHLPYEVPGDSRQFAFRIMDLRIKNRGEEPA